MTDQEIRLECLRLALAAEASGQVTDALATATLWADWALTGLHPAPALSQARVCGNEIVRDWYAGAQPASE